MVYLTSFSFFFIISFVFFFEIPTNFESTKNLTAFTAPFTLSKGFDFSFSFGFDLLSSFNSLSVNFFIIEFILKSIKFSQKYFPPNI